MKNQEVLDLLHAALYGMDELLRSFSITHVPDKQRILSEKMSDAALNYWYSRNRLELVVKRLERVSEVKVERIAKRMRKHLTVVKSSTVTYGRTFRNE